MKVGGVDREILPWEWFDLGSGEWRLAKEEWWLEPNPETGTVQARKVLIIFIALNLSCVAKAFEQKKYLVVVTN